MQSSDSSLIQRLFPEKINHGMTKKRPITAGTIITRQANQLIESLMMSSPHYIRCIKPNETKCPGDWVEKQVLHQVEYLGLKENIRVRRAGFAYRRPFDKFVRRYSILLKNSVKQVSDVQSTVKQILEIAEVRPNEYQMGITKVFVKAPESVEWILFFYLDISVAVTSLLCFQMFLLEEMRDQKIDYYARVIQKTFQKHFNQQKFFRQKEQAAGGHQSLLMIYQLFYFMSIETLSPFRHFL